ncbi:hypothetical protein Sango_0268400 [Sesamum angolense]|uniref:FAM192A/Fyv6 N-terminal domain-containing protein n=1 Tax=Sesamum angolense TaxID=2727404 RepID=A0AAE1X8T8_9LAMI|nr:hypothetical protein Sango_0268400 [Sesamum angolense]
MADDEMPPPLRLMNFVSEDQLEEARRTRGARVDDGTAQRDRSLYEFLARRLSILLQANVFEINSISLNLQAEVTEPLRPPKALDEDETEFLDKLELSRREYERQMADEEEQQLRGFQDKNSAAGRKSREGRPLGMIIKVKKAKVESGDSGETPTGDRKEAGETTQKVDSDMDVSRSVGISGLVSYSDDESEEDE